MKSFLKRFLRTAAPAAEAQTPQLAVAQLLLEIARADLNADSTELATVRAHLAEAYALDEAALDALMATAAARVEQAVSLHDTVKTVNDALNAERKSDLMRALWQVAYADGRLDPYEEALLRRLADLLYVPHATFIREKLAVLES
jgi:uncharacterized tellurite resistance protein B-like protein